MIADKYPDYILEIYGEGELKEELQKQINEYGLEKRIILKGTFINIHERIADATLFILSSDYEGLSNALLEALMMGIPCISTNCAGADEFIESGVNGLLTPVGDAAKMAISIDRMLGDKELRAYCGRNAREKAQSFSKDKVLRLWHELMG